VLILPDQSFAPLPDKRVRIIPTGDITPPKKRDIGIKEARGEVIAFLDDDAYPPQGWLKNALRNFQDPQVAAVGGPAVTPASDTILQKASGAVYASRLVSASFVYRYLPKKRREVEDYPSCNLIVRRSVLEELGGFNTDFWPGEDTKLCLDITKKLGKKIIYDPGVLVYHHRRSFGLQHFRQVANYALHRGYFVKRHPQTSFKFSYFVPSLFTAALIFGGAASFFSAPLRIAYLCGLLLYIAAVFGASILKGLTLFPFVFFGIIFTHLAYGIWFLKGLFSARLKEES